MARVGKRNKTKFVLCKELIILFAILVVMIVTTICLSIPSAESKRLAEFNDAITEYNTANSTSYSILSDDHVFRMVGLGDIEGRLADKGSEEEPKYTYVLYGTLSNSTVLQYLTTINETAKNREVEEVYLYSSSKVDNQEDLDDEDFLTGLHRDEDIFNKDVLEGIEEVDLLKVPALYVYKNGELIFNSTTLEEDGSYNWYQIINFAFAL